MPTLLNLGGVPSGQTTMQFTDLPLAPEVQSAVKECGYAEPTPVQAACIPAVLEGRDIRAIAQTGTGKTAAYALPVLTMLAGGRTRARMPRCLVACPTRELAAQVAESFEHYGKFGSLRSALLIGGVSFADQLSRLERGADILIATPGRLLDHFERGRLMLSGTQIAVIDEADRMLDMGFLPDVERIIRLLPFSRQTLLFAATMPPEVEKLADELMQAPVRVDVAPPATTVEQVQQSVLMLPSSAQDGGRSKRLSLRKLLLREDALLTNAIVFCNRKRDLPGVVGYLKKEGYSVAELHGDMDQRHRMETLDGFRGGKYRYLIASDVAARGLDIPIVSHVFNLDVPLTPDDYVHRIGRTARAGRPGSAITLCQPHEKRQMERIRELVGNSIKLESAADISPEDQSAEPEQAPDYASSTRIPSRRFRRRESREGNDLRGASMDAAAPVIPPDHADRLKEQEPTDGERRNRGQKKPKAGSPVKKTEVDNTIQGLGTHVPAFLTREYSKLPATGGRRG